MVGSSVPRDESSGPLPVVTEADSAYLWYASYASNMCTARFMCYIQGGQAEGMARSCIGGRDKTPPVDSRWKHVPHQLIFGRSFTSTWGSGGVAFLDPTPDEGSTTLMRMYKITLQQFCDVLAQENRLIPGDSRFRVEWRHINALRLGVAASSNDAFEMLPGWYGTIQYLGDEDGLPILTITCSADDMKKYRERKLPVCAPSPTYIDVIIKGLREHGLSEEEARVYVLSRSPPYQ
ncbi:hypothetical protein R1sor_010818 [Riccia sorocarpa]|uniref:Gamma-glutamylcyclotransferase n=1 Tax=Riccia sorocarpa TaxID=122646 RepID=A0ABD3I1V8_9MARC